MSNYVNSSDGTRIHYTLKGQGSRALLFVHGWLGNGAWWDDQARYFEERFSVVQMDLGGHGKSGKERSVWSSSQYAQDIRAVLSQISQDQIIIVGHSMAGPYSLEASLLEERTQAVIVVDTLKNVEQHMSIEVAKEVMFKGLRNDFSNAVMRVLPEFLFTAKTPSEVRSRLQREFLENSPEHAIKAISPLYEMDVKEAAKRTRVPVRAINSEYTPSSVETNRNYFRDYDMVTISEVGHYPMLEKPQEFNDLLDGLLRSL